MRGIGRPREADRSRGSRFRDRYAKRSRLDAVSPYVLAELAGFPSPLTACRESRSAEEVDDAATGAVVTVVRVVARVTVPTVAITVSWPVRHRLGRPAGIVARRTASHLAGMPGLAGMRSRFAVSLGRCAVPAGRGSGVPHDGRAFPASVGNGISHPTVSPLAAPRGPELRSASCIGCYVRRLGDESVETA